MKRDYVYYGVITAGVLSFAFMAWWFLGGTHQRQYTVEELRHMLREGKTARERAMGADGLGEHRDVQSVPLLFEAMQNEDPLLRGRAGTAVNKILGVDFYFAPEDPPEKREEALEKYRALYEAWKKKTGGTFN